MKKLLALLCAAMALAGCGTPDASNYKGADAGTLVLSIGYTEPSTDYYNIYYRTVAAPARYGAVSIHTSSDIFRVIDYTGADTGSVVTDRLAPGSYEFFRVVASGQDGTSHTSKNDFSLPFVIKPGETTYVGSYTAMLVTEKKRDWLLFRDYDAPGGVYFVVSDQHERDLEMARKREPNLPAVTVSVPGEAVLPKPYFTTHKLD
jgi:hypothetical protein